MPIASSIWKVASRMWRAALDDDFRAEIDDADGRCATRTNWSNRRNIWINNL